MDINQVFNQIGGFGRAQIKIVVPLNFLHIACGLQVILYTFIGEDPGWSCPDTDTTATDNCARVSEGSCTPEFSKDFTSIVTEVICWSRGQRARHQSTLACCGLVGLKSSLPFTELSTLIGENE